MSQEPCSGPACGKTVVTALKCEEAREKNPQCKARLPQTAAFIRFSVALDARLIPPGENVECPYHQLMAGAMAMSTRRAVPAGTAAPMHL